MKIKNINNPARLFEVVDNCKGTVELLTSEGDRLNLKSKLCQYIALTRMFDEAAIDEIDLIVSEPDDLMLLDEFFERQ